ncbi:hypothetical protein [Prevotella koreensis]
MFKICIYDSIYLRIVSTEKQNGISWRSNLYKLLNLQLMKTLTTEHTAKFKTYLEGVLNKSSALYILYLFIQEVLLIQKTYGVICMIGESHNLSQIIDINPTYIDKEQERQGCEFEKVLDCVETIPSNSLLKTYHYLFVLMYPFAANGIANIKGTFGEMLSEQFKGGHYNFTFIFDNNSNDIEYIDADFVKLLDDIFASFHLKKSQRQVNSLHRHHQLDASLISIASRSCFQYSKVL